MSAREVVLSTERLTVGYGGRPVIQNVSFNLYGNEVLCLLGHNGAGKTTLMNTLFGLIQQEKGIIYLDGRELRRASPQFLASSGVAYIPEGRGVFPDLTVAEIMRLGLWAAKVPKEEQKDRLDWVLSILPAIKNFYEQKAKTLSGGQQQIASIGRALLSKPRCLLMDEPSIGLAPRLFQDLLKPIKSLQQEMGMSILLVEQNVKEALAISDRVIVMKSGELILETEPSQLSDTSKLIELY